MAEEEAFEEVPMSNALSKKLRNKLQSINEEDVSSPIEAKEMFRRRVNRVLMAFDVNKRLDISNEGHYIAKVVRKRVRKQHRRRLQAPLNQEAEAEALRAQLAKLQAELQKEARNARRSARAEKSSDQALRRMRALDGRINDERTRQNVGGHTLRENSLRMQALENQEGEAEALRAQLEKRQAELQEKARNEFSAPPQNQEAEAEAETLRAQLEKRQAELQEKAGNEFRAPPQNQEAEVEVVALRAQLATHQAELQEKATNEFSAAAQNHETEALRAELAKGQAEEQENATNEFRASPQNQEEEAEAEALEAQLAKKRQAEQQEKAKYEKRAARGEKSSNQALRMEKELSGHLNDEGTHGDVGGYSPGRNLREYEINELRMQALENQEAEAEALRAQLEKRQAELQEKARNEFSAPPQNQEAEAEAEAETLRAQLEKRQAELQEKAKFEKRAARGKKLRDQALRMEKELMVRPKHVRDLQTPQNQEAEALRAQLEKRRAELQEKARNEFRDAPENQEADAEALRSQQAKRQAELQDKARNVFKDAPQNQEADAEERQAEIQEKAGNEFWAAPQNQEAEALRAQAEQQEKARNEFRAARGEKSSDQALQRVWELDGRMNDEHRHENLGGHSLDKVSRENELRDEIIIKKNVITEKEGELMKTREQLFSGELMLPLICSLMLLIALLTEWPTEDAPWTFDTVVEKVQAYMTVVFKCRVDAFGRLNQDFDRYVNSYVQFLQRASDCDFNYRRTGLTHFSLNGIPNNHVNLGRLDEELRAAREELKNLELELWTLRAVAAE